MPPRARDTFDLTRPRPGREKISSIGMVMREDAIVEVAAGVHLVHGSNTNWVILTEGDAVTLIDTGYPGDRPDVLASLDALGHSPGAISAILITHAHNDHLGSAEYLSSTYGVPVHLHEKEMPHARREFLQQVSVGQVMRQAWRPGVLPWAVHAIRSGGTADVRMTRPEPFPDKGRSICPAVRCRCTRPGTPPGTASTTCRTPAS